MKTFNLPDLGEGLAEAEIVTWHVTQGETIEADAPLVSVETAKAVVDVPSPYSGRIIKLHAAAGDVVEVHKPLVDFEIAGENASETRGETAAAASMKAVTTPESPREDSSTVVGTMPADEGEEMEAAFIIRKTQRGGNARPKAAPAARARAKALGIELQVVRPSGHRGQITPGDVERYAARPRPVPAAPSRPITPPKPVRYGQAAPLRGPRRAMALTMSASRDAVMPTTLFDDADIHQWLPHQDITVRVIRALAVGCRQAPELNAWFNGESMARTLHDHIDLALAIDTPDGLIVPVIRNVETLEGDILRHELNHIKQATRERTVNPQEMLNPTITLSNFGMMAGRYATPVIVPPQVAILGTGGIRHDVIPVLGGFEAHRRIPLSLSFDHRCATGGEACRFLAAVIGDLENPD